MRLPGRVETAELRLNVLERIGTDVLQAHPFDPSGPEECNVLMLSQFDGLQPAVVFGSDFALQHFATEGMSISTMRTHANLVNHLVPEPRVPLLKSPGYLGNYSGLEAVWGPVDIVEIERPFNEIVRSWTSLAARTAKMFGREPPTADWRAVWRARMAARETDVRQLGSDSQVVRVKYDQLIDSPVDTICWLLGQLLRDQDPRQYTHSVALASAGLNLKRWGAHEY